MGPRKLADCAVAGTPGQLRTANEAPVNQPDISYRGLPKTTVPALTEMAELELRVVK